MEGIPSLLKAMETYKISFSKIKTLFWQVQAKK
jgi:hypothetical protein